MKDLKIKYIICNRNIFIFFINNVLYPREDIAAKTTYIVFTFYMKKTVNKQVRYLR